MNIDYRRKVLGTLSSFQTILEKYPVLMADSYYGGKDTSLTAISFTLDILKLFGLSNRDLYTWLARLLSDVKDGVLTTGLLLPIEQGVKAILLSYLNGLYTCPIDPVLPDYFIVGRGKGIEIPLNKIDAFGQLQNSPTSKVGSVFYFDVNEINSEIWKSTDFNAYLWYVINKGNGMPEYSTWDNRTYYFPVIKDEDVRENFVKHVCTGPLDIVTEAGGLTKKDILFSKYNEKAPIGNFGNAETLTVWAPFSRYGIGLNSTIRQFNTDYIYSLRLFSAKTLLAQIMNAMFGLSKAFSAAFSFDINILLKKIESTVEKVLNEENAEMDEAAEDGYFVFSDEEYSDILQDATLRYNQQYETGNDTGDLADVNVEAITTYISEIDDAQTADEQQEAIISAIEKITGELSSTPEIDVSSEFTFQRDIIQKFIKTIAEQLAMQVLSPKVMLLFTINQKFLGEDVMKPVDWEAFFKDFINILKQCIRKTADLLIQELFNLVISIVKPIFLLVAKRIMLESVYYYRQLLEQLLENCRSNLAWFRNMGGTLDVANVNYADIIPKQTTPKQ